MELLAAPAAEAPAAAVGLGAAGAQVGPAGLARGPGRLQACGRDSRSEYWAAAEGALSRSRARQAPDEAAPAPATPEPAAWGPAAASPAQAGGDWVEFTSRSGEGSAAPAAAAALRHRPSASYRARAHTGGSVRKVD
jgi:hypothetical protein